MPKFYLDYRLIIPVLCLSSLGLLVLRSIAPDLIVAQLSFYAAFVVVFLLFSALDYRIFSSLSWPVYLISIIFLITTLFFGISTRGAVRWLQIGNFTLQPSEIIKPFLLMTFASLAASKNPRRLWWMLAAGFVPLLIIFIQPDLGTCLVLLVGFLTSLTVVIPPRKMFVALLAGLILIMPVYGFILRDYQRQRLITYVNPYSDPLGNGYHIIQSLIAVGSGGLFGRGLGRGTQSQLRFLPEHHTDFIFASVAEELGFAGSVVIISLFLALLWRIYRISQTTVDNIATVFCLSIASMLTFQIFINIGMNIGLVPVTGITLPFVSSGGSSLISLAIMMGMVNSVSNRYN
ncbi:MAG: Rod shape-determining protein RodA [Candidatus Amesbacteria bacterium GW2011_GWB1_47_19]|nr:MAG: Rod shape-determining protein RodA [Candidatus Amesbacteria bacterium GW2011_GWA1_44_24]KKU30939.1 MAG: Phosphoribulokinase [Candidatus Amesbacteria bacterium GW2011_GWC1_46_24]KKU66602.1 MAG: Rod shape-determining protein RodA [Candidatus Amesbacteria bacterium GW2011_GWB1_47_19]OGD05322.1 MAG: hypothetical protein A2379_01200 [Candidatus Amesbacteria bacterium RIFOXYB1_FULL_47_13]HBC73223.1 rod shape-determining protein RodA [Candidatus Amesbacteria bacterium]